MRHRFALRVILALLTLVSAIPRAHGQHQAFVRFGQRDGLANQNVISMAQDRHGILWIGTENGLFQMIGSAFVRVPSFDHGIYGGVASIHTDAQGSVWVAGDNGLVRYDPDSSLAEQPRAQISLPMADLGSITSLPGIPDTLFAIKGNQLYAIRSPDRGLTWNLHAMFSTQEIARRPELAHLVSMVSGRGQGTLWLGCGHSLCQVSVAGQGNADPAASAIVWGPQQAVPALEWNSLLCARDGSLWARGVGQVLQLDTVRQRVIRHGDPSGGATPEVSYAMLAEDRNGTILANLPLGVALLEPAGWRAFGVAQGMPSTQVLTMFFDREGGLWFAPIGLGLWRWQGYGLWQQWTAAEGLATPVTWALVRDRRQTMWAAASEDLYRIAPDGRRALPQQSGRPMHSIQYLAADIRGHIWAASLTGVLYDYDPVARRTRIVGKNLGVNLALLEDPVFQHQPAHDRIWIGSRKGAFYVSAEDGFARPHPVGQPGELKGDPANFAQNARGQLYCVAQGEIYQLDDGHWRRLQRPDRVSILAHAVFTVAPDGSLWVAGRMPTPLLHLAVDGSRLQLLEAVSSARIHTEEIIFLAVDRWHWIWAGTDDGVYVFNGASWIQCTEEDGLISNDMDGSGVYADADGSMWFGSSGGISHLLDPESLFRVSAPPLQVRSVRLGSLDLPLGQPLQVELRRPELAVEMFSNQYDRPRSVAFRYRLAGYSEEWQTTTAGRLTFSDLRPGDYTFLMQAVDTRATSSSPPVRYSFTILPPWYGRTGYRILGGALLALAIAAGWRISLRRLRSSEANLKRRVDQQTAELLAEKERLESAQKDLVEISRRDALTGLLNRSAIFAVLEEKRADAMREGAGLAIIMADLDHFKSINDRFGHAVGDAVLVECCRRLCAALRPHDAIGRYGGEEILLLIPELPLEHAPDRLENLRAAIADRPIRCERHVIDVSCSFGVAWLDASQPFGHEALAQADQALYRAKGQGRNCVRFSGAESTLPSAGRLEMPSLPVPVQLTLQN